MKYEKTLKTLCRQPKLTINQIQNAFKKNNSIEVLVTPYDMRRKGFSIQTDEGLCFVTEQPIQDLNNRYGRVTTLQERMLNLAIPIPLFIGEGTLIKNIHHIQNSQNPFTEANSWLHKNFTPEIAAAYFNKYFSVSESFSEYKTIIFESIEAYYLGLDHIAIMSLLPVFEAGLRNIQKKILKKDPDNVSSTEFEKGLKELIIKWGIGNLPQHVWHPGKGYNTKVEIDFFTHICPQCDVINSFLLFFSGVLYKPTHKGSSLNGFNRHLIIHLLKNEFHEPSNYARLFLALTQITFIEGLESKKIPLFWQGVNEEDKKISAYMRALTDNFFLPRRKILSGICSY